MVEVPSGFRPDDDYDTRRALWVSRLFILKTHETAATFANGLSISEPRRVSAFRKMVNR